MCTYVREFENHSKVKNFKSSGQNFNIKVKKLKQNIMRRLIGPINEEIASPEHLDAWGTVWQSYTGLNIIKENRYILWI